MLMLLFYKPDLFLQQNTFDTSLSVGQKFSFVIDNLKFWNFKDFGEPIFTTSEAVNESKPLYSGFSNINEQDEIILDRLKNTSNSILNFSTYKWPILTVLLISIFIISFTLYITLSQERQITPIIDNSDLISKIESLELKINEHELAINDNKNSLTDSFDSQLNSISKKILALEKDFFQYKKKNDNRENKHQITLN